MDRPSATRERFARAVAQPDEAIDLAEVALLIAAEAQPGLDVRHYLARLDRMADQVGARLTDRADARATVNALNRYLFDEQGFVGNAVEYYDPRNSYLNEVLDRRMGIPITLSIVYLEVGWRLGLPLEGVGMPGHFIVRWSAPTSELLIDVFNRGRIVSVEDCAHQVGQLYGEAMPFSPTMLAPASRRQIIVRVLANLRGIALAHQDIEAAIRWADLAIIARPEGVDEIRERGLLRYRAGDLKGAIADFERALELAPESRQAAQTRQQLRFVENLLARRN